MTLLDAIILGIIEGLTEFFPISSTGHLIIAQKGLGIGTTNLFFNTVIQVGAILAVLVYFRKKIIQTMRHLAEKSSKQYALNLIVATIPVLVVGLLFHSIVEQLQQSLEVVVLTTMGVAGLMAWLQHKYKTTLLKGKKEGEKTTFDYFIAGIYQTLSLVPGVSRSGITMLGAISRGFSFKDAMETAFLLGVPAMGAAAMFEGVKFFSQSNVIDPSIVTATAVGFVVSFFTALFTISITLPILRKYGFMPFIVYRVVLGLILLLFVL